VIHGIAKLSVNRRDGGAVFEVAHNIAFGQAGKDCGNPAELRLNTSGERLRSGSERATD
jgi:hypothetical protein